MNKCDQDILKKKIVQGLYTCLTILINLMYFKRQAYGKEKEIIQKPFNC